MSSASTRSRCLAAFLAAGALFPLSNGPHEPRATAAAGARMPDDATELHVDPRRGRDENPGTRARPLASVAAALAGLSDPVPRSLVVLLSPGRHEVQADEGAPAGLVLWRRMPPGVSVTLRGEGGAEQPSLLAWRGASTGLLATEGDWRIEELVIGGGSTEERRGVEVRSPAHVTLSNVTIHTRSESDDGILADRGGRVSLRGAIRLNEHLHEAAPAESFCGILAEDGGVIEFVEREGALLELGNGSLRTRYYGTIRLGCETARITSWGRNANNLSIANGGRIDLRNTTLVLRAPDPKNTPIGLEHDGHVLAEDARIVIEGKNDSAIALQKASTLTCNDVELRGEFGVALWASSDSTFVGRFLSPVSRLEARTGAGIHVEALPEGVVVKETLARSGGTISLPDRVIRSE